MDVVLDDSFRQVLPQKFGYQVEMVVMPNHHRRQLRALRFFNNGLGKGLVYRDIAGFPGVVNIGVHVGIIGRVPHVMLEEPEQRVA